jgi:putative heme-binding domain-containing protein
MMHLTLSRPLGSSLHRLGSMPHGSFRLAVGCLILLILIAIGGGAPAAAQPLQEQLAAEEPALLAKAIETSGDAQRGALLFHQPYLGCVKCHDVGSPAASSSAPSSIGPDLTQARRQASTTELVESLLDPAKSIAKGFETIVVELDDGRVALGLLAEESKEHLVLRNPADGALIPIRKDTIESQRVDSTSTMPAGLVNQLTSRQQFFDLIRFLIEIRDGGRERAVQLQPAPSLLALQLPAYESHVDHAGMIRDLDGEAFARGEAIYERLCVNCHGDLHREGSLPTALKFASGTFKNGSDPFAVYQTLTRGFGLMVPQTWMVPQQKYDVIHYLREAYLKDHNPSQYATVNSDYLARLPQGDTRGPPPRTLEPWVTMDYGPTLINTYEIGDDGANFAYKGIAVRLDPGPGGISRGKAWMVFDHDTLRVAAAWTGSGFIDWNGIHFNGRHQIHPRVVGDVLLGNPTGPGWADPQTQRFDDDQRVLGRDGRRYGPLPRTWGKYRGLYHFGDQAIIAYTVGETEVLESPGVVFLPKDAAPESNADRGVELPVVTRAIQVGPRNKDLLLLVATESGESPHFAPLGNLVRFGVVPEQRGASTEAPSGKNDAKHAPLLAGLAASSPGCAWEAFDGRLCLRIPAGAAPMRIALWTTREHHGWVASKIAEAVSRVSVLPDFAARLYGGPLHWPQTLATEVALGAAEGPFAVDGLTHPENNPWLAQMRFTGLDFYPDGDRAVVCAWDGDVWLVSGLSGLDADRSIVEPNTPPQLTWRRIASGLFQPLGIKVVAGQVYVTCRDQLVILRDLSGDGETDFYECFNNDHQVTEHFHEFAMGLQVDDEGSFYYAKSARHALPAVVPHHGTLLRVAANGAKTEVLATGFRAANGVCLNPDGSFVVTDQEGHWNPKNRINWVTAGGFYGNMFGYHDVQDSSDGAMVRPLCWITNAFDRSPAELVWTPPDAWGPLAGSLLNLSYGYGKLFVVPFEDVAGQKQGGLCALPIAPLPTGVMRGRFHPRDRQLYACGMFAWAGSATQAGGLYRIRYTGQPMHLPVELRARRDRLQITFTDPLDRAAAADRGNYAVKTWSLQRTANYGSEHYNERPLAVEAATVSDDGRTVSLHLPQLAPTWGMEIRCRLRSSDGQALERVIHNSIFRLSE